MDRRPSIRLTAEERQYILSSFEASTSTDTSAHSQVWKRRLYAPMYVARCDALRRQVEAAFPEHAIAFDVVFDSDGSEVVHHVDHESLVPFYVPSRWAAVRDGHFVSVHFNLTPDGGSLVTADEHVGWSYLYFWAISCFGIFSWAHALLLRWTSGLSERVHPNDVGVGNAFDNTRIHSVTAGAPRTSYVLRLVRRNVGIGLTRRSVCEGMLRSTACHAFAPLLAVVATSHKDVVDVGDVNWTQAFAAPPPFPGAMDGHDAARRSALGSSTTPGA